MATRRRVASGCRPGQRQRTAFEGTRVADLSGADGGVLHRRHPRLVHRQQRHPGPQYPNHVPTIAFPSHESLSGPRPVRETAGGQSALTSGPAPAHRRPTRQRPGRCPSTETPADSTGPAAGDQHRRAELPLLRGQPGTTHRVVSLLATRWSHDRGKTRLKRSHERGKRQCAAAHAKPSAVPQVEVAPMAATPTGLAVASVLTQKLARFEIGR